MTKDWNMVGVPSRWERCAKLLVHNVCKASVWKKVFAVRETRIVMMFVSGKRSCN